MRLMSHMRVKLALMNMASQKPKLTASGAQKGQLLFHNFSPGFGFSAVVYLSTWFVHGVNTHCITCKTCKKQYVGQTKLRCMDRIQAHFNTIQSKDPKQQNDISRHFKQADHNGRSHVQVHILDFIYAFPDSRRAMILRNDTEFRWIH